MNEPFLTCPTLQHTAEHGIVLLSIKLDVVGHIGDCHGIEDEPGIQIKLYLKKEILNSIYDHIEQHSTGNISEKVDTEQPTLTVMGKHISQQKVAYTTRQQAAERQ